MNPVTAAEQVIAVARALDEGRTPSSIVRDVQKRWRIHPRTAWRRVAQARSLTENVER